MNARQGSGQIRPQAHPERLFQLGDRDQIRPSLAHQDRPNGRVMDAHRPAELTQRPLPHCLVQVHGPDCEVQALCR